MRWRRAPHAVYAPYTLGEGFPRELSPALPARVRSSPSRRKCWGCRRALAVARGGGTGLGREHKLARARPSGANPRAGLQAIDPTATASEFDPGDWTAAGDQMPVTPPDWMLRGMGAATHRCGGAVSVRIRCFWALAAPSPRLRGEKEKTHTLGSAGPRGASCWDAAVSAAPPRLPGHAGKRRNHHTLGGIAPRGPSRWGGRRRVGPRSGSAVLFRHRR
jgi:hypothetical protein